MYAVSRVKQRLEKSQESGWHLVWRPSARLAQTRGPRFEIRLNIFITRLSLPGMTFAEYRIMSDLFSLILVLASIDARLSCARSSPYSTTALHWQTARHALQHPDPAQSVTSNHSCSHFYRRGLAMKQRRLQ